MKIVLTVILICVIMSGCAEKIVSECDTGQQRPSGRTLGSIQTTVFTPRCAVSGCHSGDMPAEGLNLQNGKSYAGLYLVKSKQDPSIYLVLPSNSAQSYLLQKMSNPAISIMPPAGKLTDALIDSVAAWIDAGALNN